MVKGLIAEMVTKKKVNLTKAINRRSETVHYQTVLKRYLEMRQKYVISGKLKQRRVSRLEIHGITKVVVCVIT